MVKPDFYAFLRFCKVPKMPVLQGFFAFLIFRSGVGYARSQSKRATNCATPRNDSVFNNKAIISVFYVKVKEIYGRRDGFFLIVFT